MADGTAWQEERRDAERGPTAIRSEHEELRDAILRVTPLAVFVLAALVVGVVMPSALLVPTTQPSESVEFSPIPPEDEPASAAPAPFERLGLGTSESDLGEARGGNSGSGPEPPPPPPIAGAGADPSQYRCVEGRQTEDPSSPPCVAFFEGDNGGATRSGVTAETVDILYYTDGNVTSVGGSRGAESAPTATYVDLVEDEPDDDDHFFVRIMRGWQQYFNTRYQTYGRTVRFHVFFSQATRTAEARRSDAEDNLDVVDPFAVIVDPTLRGNGDAYVETMLDAGVMAFGSYMGQGGDFYRRHPGLLWGYAPSLEIQAAQFADVLCRKYLGPGDFRFRVDHSTDFVGDERVFGLVFTTDPAFPGLRAMKDTVVDRFRDCGGTVAATGTFPRAGFSQHAGYSSAYALEVMADFVASGVTTIIWPGGLETNFSRAAAQLDYRPEWIVLGDGLTESESTAATQEQSVWANAVVMSNQPMFTPDPVDRVCYQAYRSVDPGENHFDVHKRACPLYAGLRQLFTGIQVAGPRLTETSMERGFRAIPPIASTNPQVPSCFYLPNDYTCVKDLVLARYDPSSDDRSTADAADSLAGAGTGGGPGCYRFAGGQRWLRSEIPGGNATAQMQPDDPCLGYDTSVPVNVDPTAT